MRHDSTDAESDNRAGCRKRRHPLFRGVHRTLLLSRAAMTASGPILTAGRRRLGARHPDVFSRIRPAAESPSTPAGFRNPKERNVMPKTFTRLSVVAMLSISAMGVLGSAPANAACAPRRHSSADIQRRRK